MKLYVCLTGVRRAGAGASPRGNDASGEAILRRVRQKTDDGNELADGSPLTLPQEATVSYADYWSRRLGTIGHLKVSLLFTSGSWLESPVPEAIAALPSSKDLENDSANP